MKIFKEGKALLSIILMVSLLVGSIQLGFTAKAETEANSSHEMKLLASTTDEVPWTTTGQEQSAVTLETPVSLTKLRLQITRLSSWNKYRLMEVRIYDENGEEIQQEATPTVHGSMTSEGRITNLNDGYAVSGQDFTRTGSSTRTPTDEYLEFAFSEEVTVSKVTLETSWCYDGNGGGDAPFGWQIWGNSKDVVNKTHLLASAPRVIPDIHLDMADESNFGKDTSGNGNDAIVVGNYSAANGYDGDDTAVTGFTTTGNKMYLQRGEMTFSNDYSISISFNAYQFATQDTMLVVKRNRSLNQRDFQLHVQSDGRIVFILRDANDWVWCYGPKVTLGEWHTAVATVKGDLMQLYYDGELVDSNVITNGRFAENDSPIGIGGDPNDGFCFNGSISDVKISDEAATYPKIMLSKDDTIEVCEMKSGTKIFSDRDYVWNDQMLEFYKGMDFNSGSIEGGRYTVLKGGLLYALTPDETVSGSASQEERLRMLGFKRLEGLDFLAFGDNTNYVHAYCKQVLPGEILDIGKWAIISADDLEIYSNEGVYADVYVDDNGTIQYGKAATVTYNNATMSGNGLSQVADGDYTTGYCSEDNPNMSDQYIQYSWNEPIDINMVTLYSQYCGTANRKGQAPTEWTIQVSKDGTTFTEVCKVSKEWNDNDNLQSKNSQFDLQEDILAMRVVITNANLDWAHYAVYEIEVSQTVEGFVASDITGTTPDYIENWENNSGEVLYNGITLPEEWPPKTIDQYRDGEMPVPYLTDKPNVININTGRQLFVDDFLIESTTLSREWHKAKKYEGNPVMKPETEQELGRERDDGTTFAPMAAPFSGGVWYDSEDKLFKMWYCAGWFDGTALATSKDGVTWERGEYDVEPGTNLVIPLRDAERDSAAVIMDPFAPATERFKMFLWSRPIGGEVYTSADGIHWGEPTSVAETGDRSTIFYNPFRDKWVYSIRSGWSERSRSYSECDDLIEGANLENTVNWARADSLDIPIPENNTTPALYNLDAVAYESIMLGAFSIYLGPSNEICQYNGTPKITELHMGFSRDGFHWSRSEDRTAFIGATQQENSWERGYIQSNASICLVNDDELWFYYTGFEGDESKAGDGYDTAANGMYSNASTGLATLRRDGFASMNAVNTTGELVTEKVTFNGKYLFVNADVKGGSVKAEILDENGNVIEGYSASDCTAVTGDTTKAMLTFGKDLSSLSGKNVKIRFEVENGKLYSFWVSDDSVNGASNGYLAGGSIGQKGLVDNADSYVTTGDITAITDASVTLGESITVNYYATLADEYKEATMQFTMNEKVVPVKGELVEGNEYRFSFEGVSPQCMTDEIKAQLVYGEEILDTHDSFTIRSYCDSLLASDATTLGKSEEQYTAMKTLIADLLQYGAMSQTYRNYKTDALANKNITGQREFVELTQAWKAAPTNTGENIKITAGGVWFANVNKLYLKFTTKDISNTTLEFGGKIYTSEDFELVSGNTYIFYSDAIPPTQFGVGKTAQFKYGDTVEASITYSVNHYVYAKQTQETAMGNLARALYNYGISAVAYTALQ